MNSIINFLEATFATSVCGGGAVIRSTVEAVVMIDVADRVKSSAVRMILADVRNTEPGAGVTLVPRVTVRVQLTLAGVVSQVTHGGGILTVKFIVGASCRESIEFQLMS